MRFLIVEDSYVARATLLDVFREFGECDFAPDASEALANFARAHRMNQPYHMVLLDIGIPGMDGIGVLGEMRRLEREKGIAGLDRVKIVMATASKENASILGAFREECDGYLTKPYGRASIVESLKRFGIKLEPAQN